MLFDDANANFDIKNDNKFMEVVKSFKGDRTLVIVSHRPSFLRVCDRQFILQDGQLIEKKEMGERPARVPVESVPRIVGGIA